MMKWTVYCHTHVESGRRYIGLTKNTVLYRWNRHVYSANRTENGKPSMTGHFPNAIRKYGKYAFSHEVLEVHDSLEAANEAEERLIAKFETQDPKKGFNLARGGSCGVFHRVRKNPWDDPEYRAKMIEKSRDVWKRPEVLNKARMAQIGKKASVETRAKIGVSSLGRKLSSEAKAKISAIHKGKHQNTEVVAKRAQARRGKKNSPEHVLNVIAANVGRRLTAETRGKISLALKNRNKIKP